MWLYNLINSIELFIILHPIETAVFLIFICTLTGSYLEHLIQWWDWGLKCGACKEYYLHRDSIVLCTKCDEYRCNDEYQKGRDKAEFDVMSGGH